jgi:hypothetical protein
VKTLRLKQEYPACSILKEKKSCHVCEKEQRAKSNQEQLIIGRHHHHAAQKLERTRLRIAKKQRVTLQKQTPKCTCTRCALHWLSPHQKAVTM